MILSATSHGLREPIHPPAIRVDATVAEEGPVSAAEPHLLKVECDGGRQSTCEWRDGFLGNQAEC